MPEAEAFQAPFQQGPSPARPPSFSAPLHPTRAPAAAIVRPSPPPPGGADPTQQPGFDVLSDSTGTLPAERVRPASVKSVFDEERTHFSFHCSGVLARLSWLLCFCYLSASWHVVISALHSVQAILGVPGARRAGRRGVESLVQAGGGLMEGTV